MASLITKKKKYKFQVDVCLEELLEVSFVSAVLFAKLRLLDGGNFQDYSTREEVTDHKVKWAANFRFPCKMMANATTGVLERCVLRISVRKECKGGRSFTKLGFVDLNLAQYAGAGIIYKKALLEGYDSRRRQDNSMLKFTLTMSMLSGDVLFKVPSSVTSEDRPATENGVEEFSGDSHGGSIASGSSGFGSLPKKRPALLSSELVSGQSCSENHTSVTTTNNHEAIIPNLDVEEIISETGHSRNSSNTSQLSKGSGYGSNNSHTHSRQSSSGDSGHNRILQQRPLRKSNVTDTNNQKFVRPSTHPTKFKIIDESPLGEEDLFFTPPNCLSTHLNSKNALNTTRYFTPATTPTSIQHDNNSANQTECVSLENSDSKSNQWSALHNIKDLQLDQIRNVGKLPTNCSSDRTSEPLHSIPTDVCSTSGMLNNVPRSHSEFEIPRLCPNQKKTSLLHNIFFKSDSLYSFFTPRPKRKTIACQVTPKRISPTANGHFKYPAQKVHMHSLPETRTTSLNSLPSTTTATGPGGGNHLASVNLPRTSIHRKLLEGTSGTKLAQLAMCPDETSTASVASECPQISIIVRRPSITKNPSTGSLVLSETGSLDRAKAAYERRKKTQGPDVDGGTVTGRVEITRVNPDHLIAELLKNTNLEQGDESTESSGLQLFIAKDGTAAVGNHEVKSQMSTGLQFFKQVVMEDER